MIVVVDIVFRVLVVVLDSRDNAWHTGLPIGQVFGRNRSCLSDEGIHGKRDNHDSPPNTAAYGSI